MHLCVVRTAERDRVRAELGERGVGTAVHYPRSIGQQPAYEWLATHTPNADAWAAQCVSLPCFPEMTDEEIELVGDALMAVRP
jgi:dTDP-4-amino-4,6-dideoxygalactose transaminase